MADHRDPNTIPSPLPADYDRQADFTAFEASYPNKPHKGTSLDAEFNAIAQAIVDTQDRLALIQRDDGALKNGAVSEDALDDALQGKLNDAVNIAETVGAQAAAAALAAQQSQSAAGAFASQAQAQAVIAEQARLGVEEAIAEAGAFGVDFLNFSLNADGELIVEYMGVVNSDAFGITADGFLEVTI